MIEHRYVSDKEFTGHGWIRSKDHIAAEPHQSDHNGSSQEFAQWRGHVLPSIDLNEQSREGRILLLELFGIVEERPALIAWVVDWQWVQFGLIDFCLKIIKRDLSSLSDSCMDDSRPEFVLPDFGLLLALGFVPLPLPPFTNAWRIPPG